MVNLKEVILDFKKFELSQDQKTCYNLSMNFPVTVNFPFGFIFKNL